MYYSLTPLLSHNCLINMVIGNRGGGKTFEFKRWAIDDFKKRGKQFIYLRRYKTELEKDNNIKNFFADIKFKYPNDEFEVKGGRFYINGQVAGYYISLSTAITKKSVSFPEVNKLCYDEFIIDKGNYHYLANEVKQFLDFLETVFRTRDDWRAVLLANAISVINPYFLYFNISPDLSKRFNKRGDVLVELYTNQDFINMKKNTRFGKLIENTEYGAYAIENIFTNDNYEFIEDKTDNAKYYCTLTYKNKDIGVWCDFKEGLFFITNKIDLSYPIHFTLTSSDHKPNVMLISSANDNVYIKQLKKGYMSGCVRFQNIKVKGYMFEIFKLLNFIKN